MGHRPLILLAALAIGCTPAPEPEPPPQPPPAPVDAGLPDEQGTPCERACARMQRLGCPEGDPTPMGQPCERWFCDAVKAEIVPLRPECLATITACEQVDDRCR